MFFLCLYRCAPSAVCHNGGLFDFVFCVSNYLWLLPSYVECLCTSLFCLFSVPHICYDVQTTRVTSLFLSTLKLSRDKNINKHEMWKRYRTLEQRDYNPIKTWTKHPKTHPLPFPTYSTDFFGFAKLISCILAYLWLLSIHVHCLCTSTLCLFFIWCVCWAKHIER